MKQHLLSVSGQCGSPSRVRSQKEIEPSSSAVGSDGNGFSGSASKRSKSQP
jgi:hypothetical protein